MAQQTFGSSYHTYLHRLASMREVNTAVAEFGEDLTRDSENGALSSSEQRELVLLFAEKLGTIDVIGERSAPSEEAELPAPSPTTPCSFFLTLPEIV